MTESIYMPSIDSCYIFDFEATVKEKDAHMSSIVLDKSAFYPEGGGQPSDKGKIFWNERAFDVISVRRSHGKIIHILEGNDTPPIGETIQCRIDRDMRYAHMRMHTSQHLISAICWKLFSAKTVGNQIHIDRSHIDLRPLNIEKYDIERIRNEFDRLVSEGHMLHITEMDIDTIRSSVGTERVDLTRLPKDIRRLRTVIIGEAGNIDLCPCAGTHVKSLSELGGLGPLSKRSKGSDTVRLEYSLLPRL